MKEIKKRKMLIKAKKTQVTIFVIIAIVIIAVVVLAFVFKEKLGFGGKISVQNQVKDNIEQCIDERAGESIYYLGLQGGYYNPPENSLDVSFLSVPVYFDKGTSLIPSLDTVKKELNDAISRNVASCFDLSEFEEQGYEVQHSSIIVESNIRTENIEIKVNTLLTLTKEDASIQFNNFAKKINFDYLSKYKAVQEFIELQATDKDYIFLTQLEVLGEKYDFTAKLNGIA